jgi:hypothetical protein
MIEKVSKLLMFDFKNFVKIVIKKIVIQFVIAMIAQSISAQSIEAFVSTQNKYNTDVWIEKIIIGNGRTEVKMQIKPDESDIEIFLYPPQSEQSVILRTFEKSYQLLSADSIPFYPEKATVLLDETKSFSLFYEEIPENVTEVDVIERVEPFDSGFSFFNVKLSKEKEKKISLRFNDYSDFKAYFEKKSQLHPMEGFWEIEKEVITSFKKKKKQPIEDKSNESVAVVKEDGLLRAYYSNGEECDIAIKELDNYFVLHSEMIEASILLDVSNDQNEIKLFGLLDKSSIYPNRKERKKVEDVILRTFWIKNKT